MILFVITLLLLSNIIRNQSCFKAGQGAFLTSSYCFYPRCCIDPCANITFPVSDNVCYTGSNFSSQLFSNHTGMMEVVSSYTTQSYQSGLSTYLLLFNAFSDTECKEQISQIAQNPSFTCEGYSQCKNGGVFCRMSHGAFICDLYWVSLNSPFDNFIDHLYCTSQ